MDIVFISDTHTKENKIEIPKCDVLVHSGDIMSCGYQVRQLFKFNKWCRTLKENGTVKQVVVVAGNHDRRIENEPHLAEEILCDVVYLQDKSYTYEGVKFYGSPWQPAFYDWAFNIKRGLLSPYWDKIPNDTDILVTHSPPYGVGDMAKCPSMYDRANMVDVGCEELTEAVVRVKPKIHAFGHIHSGYGVEHMNGTTFVNASICTEEYKPTNQPIKITL